MNTNKSLPQVTISYYLLFAIVSLFTCSTVIAELLGIANSLIRSDGTPALSNSTTASGGQQGARPRKSFCAWFWHFVVGGLHRVSAALHGSIHATYEISLVLSLTMLTATFVLSVQAQTDNATTFYEFKCAALFARVASLCTISIWCQLEVMGRITPQSAILFGTNCCMTAVLLNVQRIIGFPPTREWEALCITKRSSWRQLDDVRGSDIVIYISLVGCVLVNRWLWETGLPTRFCNPSMSLILHRLSLFRLLFALLLLGNARMIMYFLQQTRASMRGLIEASDQEDVWGFGQSLAVATWLPAFARLVYVFIGEAPALLHDT